MICSTLSVKFKALTVFSMMAVLYIHAKILESAYWPLVDFIQRFVNNFARFAVPTFFIISGYCFFNNITKTADIYLKIKKRTKTLLIPYLFWCTTFIIIVTVGGLVVKSHTDYIGLLLEGDYFGFIRYVFWTPAAFHLWYVRDLYIIVCITPLLYLLLKKVPWIIVLLSYVLYAYNILPTLMQGVFFFSIGAFYSIHSREPFKEINPYLALLFFSLSLILMQLNYTANFIRMGLCLLLTIGVWRVYDFLPWFFSSPLILKISSYSFFVYCAHIPLLIFIKSAIFPCLIGGQVGALLSFIISPIICVIVLLAISYLLKRISPSCYYLITGGR